MKTTEIHKQAVVASQEDERLRQWRARRKSAKEAASSASTEAEPSERPADKPVFKDVAPSLQPTEHQRAAASERSQDNESNGLNVQREKKTDTTVQPPETFAPLPEPDRPSKPARPPEPEPTVRSLPMLDPIEEQRQKLRRQNRARTRKFWGSIAIFAILPALLAAAYEFFVAVPLYEARSVMIVSKASSVGDQSYSGILGAIGASGSSNISEAFMAQEYVQSQSLLEDLEDELGFISRLSGSEIDPLRRLRNFESIGVGKRTQFQRFVRSSVNVQTGMLTLYVRAPSVEEVERVSTTILQRIEARVNDLSDQLFEQQVLQAHLDVEEAQQFLVDIQRELSRLQIDSGEANPEIRVAGIYDSIASIEAELLEIETQIAEAAVSGRAESFETERLAALRKNLETRIVLMRDRLIERGLTDSDQTLSALLLDFQRLQLQMELGQQSLASALASLEQSQTLAALGRSQFQVVVPPLAAEIPWRPRPLSAALVVFLIAMSTLSVARLFRPR